MSLPFPQPLTPAPILKSPTANIAMADLPFASTADLVSPRQTYKINQTTRVLMAQTDPICINYDFSGNHTLVNRTTIMRLAYKYAIAYLYTNLTANLYTPGNVSDGVLHSFMNDAFQSFTEDITIEDIVVDVYRLEMELVDNIVAELYFSEIASLMLYIIGNAKYNYLLHQDEIHILRSDIDVTVYDIGHLIVEYNQCTICDVY